MAQTNNEFVPKGALGFGQEWGEFNKHAFVIQQFINKVQTATLVRVDSVTNAGGVSPVGFVDVTPMVNQMDSQGLPTPHVTIYNVPYMRVQGGDNAVIIDPQVGDIGICVFASRDISKVKKTKAQANPGSLRKYSFADGLYIGGVLNGTPTQYVQFSGAGITITSPTAVTINAPTLTVNGNTVLNGTLSQTGGGASTFSGDLSTATGNVTASGVSLKTHAHSGVQAGGSNTGGPV